MKNTKPLKEFLQEALADDEKKHYSNASKWHNEWLGKYGRNQGEWYKAMYRCVCTNREGKRERERE